MIRKNLSNYQSIIIFILIVVLTGSYPLLGQSANLLLNPDFETYVVCPTTYAPQDGSHTMIPNWGYPTLAAPDYFNRCGKGEAGVPRNFAGSSEPKSGNAYAGFYSSGWDPEYREYLTGELREPLKAGKKYCVRYSFKLASFSNFACDQMGVYFTDKKTINSSKVSLGFTPQIHNPEGDILDNIDYWQEVCEIYTSKGGETFMIIGNFKNYENTNYIAIDRNPGLGDKKQAYYYIDDIHVVALDACVDCPCVAQNLEAVFVDTSYTGGRDPITGKVKKIVNDGKIRIAITGGAPPYDITWSNGAKTAQLMNLPAGKYTYTVTDKNLCKVSGSIEFKQPVIEKDEFLDGLKNIEEGSAIVLKNIFFEFGKTNLLPESFIELDKVAAFMMENQIKMIEISGHTDNKGSDASNQTLSQGRAGAVVNYLTSKGVNPSSLTAMGYGESKPIDTNETEEGRAQNRRVEFKLIKK
ncbi:MAG: OmpA family protein [Bacteroidales bacterium]|nr:OmpA family protein [Bacteroidales bacterium]